jgi:DNA-binding LytR/AlgR family response regulator
MKKSRILIVENEPLIAMDVKMSLEKLGYEVIGSAATYQEALAKAYENKPDIALMDINLDGNKDGIQAAKVLKAHYDIPVVFLTSLTEVDTIKRALESEPFGYLIKPFKQDDLRSSIEIALYNHYKTANLQSNLDKITNAMNVLEMPLVILNETGMIEYINNQMERISGWRKEDKKGASINKLLTINELPAWNYIEMQDDGLNRKVHHFDIATLVPRTGVPRPMKGQLSFFHTPETGVSGYVITLINPETDKPMDAGTESAPNVDLTGQFVDDYFFLKDKSSLYRIHIDQINYIEALGNYVKVNTGKKSYTALIPLKDIEKLLPAHKFFRIHRSYIVSVDKITAIHASELEIGDTTLPIGKTFKDDLLKKIQVI